MLKKLRIKFIALNMITVAVVLTAVFATICVVNYQQSVAVVEATLNDVVNQASDHQEKRQPGKDGQPDGGAAPEGGDASADQAAASGEGGQPAVAAQTPDGGSASVASSSDATGKDSPTATGAGASTFTAGVADDADGFGGPTIGGRDKGGGQVIPVALFTVDANGVTAASGRFNTASISDDVLEQAGAELVDAAEGFGKLSDSGLFYLKRQAGGDRYLAFADISSARGWESLAATLAVIEVATLAVFFVISLFFSRWALGPVARAWVQQRRFVADASHDLKTPLTVILANTSIALEHPERSVASQSQWLESTQHEAEAMQGLVGDLLELAKMDEEEAAASAGAPRANFEPVDLSDLVEGELLQFESVAFERGVQLEPYVQPGISLSGNKQRLRRLASTLIDNACKYVDEGGVVEVALSETGKHAKLTVRNTGAPIAPEDLPHVFDRFYRADKARTSGAGGHGLGLAIARAIAEEHRGTLTVASTQEAGTTFTATLPIK